jgi:hypothetical protein
MSSLAVRAKAALVSSSLPSIFSISISACFFKPLPGKDSLGVT